MVGECLAKHFLLRERSKKKSEAEIAFKSHIGFPGGSCLHGTAAKLTQFGGADGLHKTPSWCRLLKSAQMSFST